MQSYRPQLDALEDRQMLSTSQYVVSLFGDFLNRAPTPTESTTYINALNTGTPPQSVALTLATSAEAIDRQTTLDYQNLLARSPSTGDLDYWRAARQQGLSVQRQEADILGSDEFFSRMSNTPSNWVNGVYMLALNRAPDPQGQSFFLSLNLLDPAVRAQAAATIALSSEADSFIVSQDYQLLLRRTADAGGLTYWTSQLNAGVPVEQMMATIASSPEYIATRANGLDFGS